MNVKALIYTEESLKFLNLLNNTLHDGEIQKQFEYKYNIIAHLNIISTSVHSNFESVAIASDSIVMEAVLMLHYLPVIYKHRERGVTIQI